MQKRKNQSIVCVNENEMKQLIEPSLQSKREKCYTEKMKINHIQSIEIIIPNTVSIFPQM